MSSVTIRIVSDEAGWDEIAPAWMALHAASPSASITLRFEWMRHWWRIYGPVYRGGGLRLITVWRGSSLIGLLPLYESAPDGVFAVRHLRFISTGEQEYEETCPDYLDALLAPGEEAGAITAIHAALRELDGQHVEMLNLVADSPLVSHLCRVSQRRWSVFDHGVCPVANLEGGFASYLQRLAAGSRQQARRILREGEQLGAVLRIAGSEDIDSSFDDLVKLHQERWVAEGEAGCFAAPRFALFHRTLAHQWIPEGKALLASLSIGAQPIAAIYGFLAGSKFDFYQSGTQIERSPLHSPGTLAHLLLMKHLCERGVTAYDFLRGSTRYKERLASERRPLISIETWRPSARTYGYRAFDFAKRIIRRAGRVSRGRIG